MPCGLFRREPFAQLHPLGELFSHNDSGGSSYTMEARAAPTPAVSGRAPDVANGPPSGQIDEDVAAQVVLGVAKTMLRREEKVEALSQCEGKLMVEHAVEFSQYSRPPCQQDDVVRAPFKRLAFNPSREATIVSMQPMALVRDGIDKAAAECDAFAQGAGVDLVAL